MHSETQSISNKVEEMMPIYMVVLLVLNDVLGTLSCFIVAVVNKELSAVSKIVVVAALGVVDGLCVISMTSSLSNGESVGCELDKTAVGSMLLGVSVGSVVGSFVGSSVGLFVGDTDGDVVGDMDGNAEGDSVGGEHVTLNV